MARPATKTGLEYGALSDEARQRKTTPQSLHQRALVLQGRCAQCGQTREKGYSWFCRPHTDAAAQRYAEARAAGRCRCGAETDDDHAYCVTCRKRRAEATARRRART